MPKLNVFALPALPAADVFPMMSEDELQELADDIKENGLREPLVIADIETAKGRRPIHSRDHAGRRTEPA
jgi:ParB-like chromosome segregation protein Spo0J